MTDEAPAPAAAEETAPRRVAPNPADDLNGVADPQPSWFVTHGRKAVKDFAIAAMQLPKRIVFSGPVMAVLVLGSAYGIWNYFYPSAASHYGQKTREGVDAVADTLISWVRALEIGGHAPAETNKARPS